MCRDMEEIYNEGEQNGFERGAEKKAKEIVLSMAEEGMELETIAKLVKISVAKVRNWTEEGLVVTR